jgi:hypothetical protein
LPASRRVPRFIARKRAHQERCRIAQITLRVETAAPLTFRLRAPRPSTTPFRVTCGIGRNSRFSTGRRYLSPRLFDSGRSLARRPGTSPAARQDRFGTPSASRVGEPGPGCTGPLTRGSADPRHRGCPFSRREGIPSGCRGRLARLASGSTRSGGGQRYQTQVKPLESVVYREGIVEMGYA